MTDTSDHFTSRGSRTTPDAIAERQFSQVKRGYAESEVRAYLRMVSSDFATAASRERELSARVRELEEQLQRPVLPPSDQDLIAALGEETARVLGQARESAVELRNKAEEHARRVVREAQETARELRTTTQQAVEAKTREAEDAARARAKEIVGEARALRDRVLSDLEERRQQLEHQIAELRTGRGRLVETYELVERALSHAARVMADEPSSAPEVPTPAPSGAEPATAPESTSTSPEARASEPMANVVAEPPTDAPTEAVSTADAAVEEPPTEATDVGALFEKLRSGQGSDDGEPEVVEPKTAEPETVEPKFVEPEGSETKPPPGEGDATPPEGVSVAPAPEADSDSSETGSPDSESSETGTSETDRATGDPATVARDAALAAITDDLVRRGKRALQDEQNDMLDGLRRQRGKIDTGKVLPPVEDQATRWAHVLQPAVDRAYSAGAASVEGSPAMDAAPRALLTELSTTVVAPLRERLTSSLQQVDSRTPADTEIAVAQTLGARYREWRGEELEGVLGDVMAAAWSRAVFDAAPDGARLRWVPAVVGRCPDCDDNALEPTVKGSDFPTGQPHPPAHPGCRCLLVVDAS